MSNKPTMLHKTNANTATGRFSIVGDPVTDPKAIAAALASPATMFDPVHGWFPFTHLVSVETDEGWVYWLARFGSPPGDASAPEA